MLDQKTLHAALKKVSAAMMHLENTGFEEKYPIGLIDINLWEWPQGVGLYGLYNYYKLTGDRGTFDFLCGWYDARMAEGLPERNVNTTCPMLTLLCVYEDTQDERYGALCRDWAEWVMHGLIRTGDGAFQHMITGDANDSQMLIDTLFMTVLFLAKAGVVFGRKDYVEEAKRQCLVHIKYLYDTSCGLYFHGYDFKGSALSPSSRGCGSISSTPSAPRWTRCAPARRGTACGIRSWTTRRLIRKARPRRRLPTECSRASVWAFCPRSMRRRPCAPCRPCWPAWMPRASWAAFPTARLWAMTHSFIRISPSVP